MASQWTEMGASNTWKEALLHRLDTAPENAPVLEVWSNATQSARVFIEGHRKTFRTFTLVPQIAQFADNASIVAKAILEGEKPLPFIENPLMPYKEGLGPFSKTLREVHSAMNEMYVCRVVDNFNCYLSDIIRECLVVRPEIVGRNEKVSAKEIFELGDAVQIKKYIVDSIVDRLSYLGFLKLTDWMIENFGIGELKSFGGKHALMEATEIRNCIVHNRGYVNRKYAEVCGNSKQSPKIGDPIVIDFNEFLFAFVSTVECVQIIDCHMAENVLSNGSSGAGG